MACAAAWPQAPGQTQWIVSYEPSTADTQFDGHGRANIPLGTWDQTDVSIYADHGLTKRLSLTAKINFQDYKTVSTHFSGVGSVEIGARWTVHKGEDFVFALGASAEGLGKGRRSDFDAPGAKAGTDYDLRAYFGKGFKLGKRDAFVNIEAARHLRQYDTDQWRVDSTFGLKPSSQWMILAQSFAGQTDKLAGSQARWNNVQLSLVRSFGPHQKTSLQLGARQTVTGRNVPRANAVVLSLWKTF
ncbi:MAG TPA: hypothetical protein VG839_09155 [Asticcacaulis sp.]|nr:hypothetical protein [Asticcacaulis sp.]